MDWELFKKNWIDISEEFKQNNAEKIRPYCVDMTPKIFSGEPRLETKPIAGIEQPHIVAELYVPLNMPPEQVAGIERELRQAMLSVCNPSYERRKITKHRYPLNPIVSQDDIDEYLKQQEPIESSKFPCMSSPTACALIRNCQRCSDKVIYDAISNSMTNRASQNSPSHQPCDSPSQPDKTL